MKIIHPLFVAIGFFGAVASCSDQECKSITLVHECGNEPCTYKVESTGPFVSDHLKQTVTNIYKRSCASPPDSSICSKFNGMDETGCLRNQCSYLVRTTEPFSGGAPKYDFECNSRLV
ncbi:hypothetical protein LRAMOSA09096 [Lichtheimia ramosa]|uniref:Uncharacterized protein n=1 Tax=Lichtheimia ramosa TaxID=688394 RepID=A0A077WHU3_9FUNG|nr:hypothetical protein LRAMOSA09096 [Lichtheimia ramosa]